MCNAGNKTNHALDFAAADYVNNTDCAVQQWQDIRTPVSGTCGLNRLMPDFQAPHLQLPNSLYST